MKTQAQKAADHFNDLYKEEIEAGKMTSDTIHEWWNMTKDQYPDTNLSDVEREIYA